MSEVSSLAVASSDTELDGRAKLFPATYRVIVSLRLRRNHRGLRIGLSDSRGQVCDFMTRDVEIGPSRFEHFENTRRNNAVQGSASTNSACNNPIPVLCAFVATNAPSEWARQDMKPSRQDRRAISAYILDMMVRRDNCSAW